MAIKPNCSMFDKFWEEVQIYLDEITLAVDERRLGDIFHMPLAISVRHLQEVITERLKKKCPDSTPPIPSQKWVRLQFWPSNPFTEQAICYTGRFKVIDIRCSSTPTM